MSDGRCGEGTDVNNGHQVDDESDDESGIPRHSGMSGTAQPVIAPAIADARTSPDPQKSGQSRRYYRRSTRSDGLLAPIACHAMAVKAAVADIKVP